MKKYPLFTKNSIIALITTASKRMFSVLDLRYTNEKMILAGNDNEFNPSNYRFE
jgi:hypothetical protein